MLQILNTTPLQIKSYYEARVLDFFIILSIYSYQCIAKALKKEQAN